MSVKAKTLSPVPRHSTVEYNVPPLFVASKTSCHFSSLVLTTPHEQEFGFRCVFS
ncbi:hypothetical protein D9M69_04810 [compost metagenome]